MKDKYSTLIKATWVVLICCFIVKLLGGNFFEIACNNERFVKFCAKYQNTIIDYITGILMYTFSTGFYLLAIFKKKVDFKDKNVIIMFLSTIAFAIMKILIQNNIIIILEIIFLIIIPILQNIKRWYRPIIAYILLFIFQLISLIIKNVGIKIIDDNFLTAVIFSIDYYIMILLYYFYTIKEEGDKNGKIWNFISRNRKRRNDNSNS